MADFNLSNFENYYYQRYAHAFLKLPSKSKKINLATLLSGHQIYDYEKKDHQNIDWMSRFEKYPTLRQILSDRFLSILNLENIDSDVRFAEAIKAVKTKEFDFLLLNLTNYHVANGESNKLRADLIKNILLRGGVIFYTTLDGKKYLSNQKKNENSLVPLIVIGEQFKKKKTNLSVHPFTLDEVIECKNSIADVTPTILQFLQIDKPPSVNGCSLLRRLK